MAARRSTIMLRSVSRTALVMLACLPGVVLGAMYKCTDAQGHVSYSQTPEPGKRCVEATLPPVQVIPAQRAPEGASPRGGDERPAAQPGGTDTDIAAAQKALDEARKKLAEQEAIRYGDERNYQKVLDRLKPYQDEVARAEARLKQLQQGGGQPALAPEGRQ
jgi:hypothetical protein